MIVESIRNVVVLPAPLAPSSPKTSLSRHSKLMPSTARIVPRDSSTKVLVRLQTTTGASVEDSAIKRSSAAEELTERGAWTFEHEAFPVDDPGCQLQCQGHENEFDDKRDHHRL